MTIRRGEAVPMPNGSLRKMSKGNVAAKTGEDYIQKLFVIESKADKLAYTADERLHLRQRRLVAMVGEDIQNL